MRVTRTQWPVGQGTFATGRVQFSGSGESYEYVYDCGSQSSKLIAATVETYAQTVERYAKKDARVDGLFVSHFDSDHVNGIDALTSRLVVDTLYLPYCNEDAVLFDLLGAMSQGALTTNRIEAQLAPEEWAARRGVRRVVRVVRGPDDPPGEPTPETPIPPDSPFRERDADKRDAGRGSRASSGYSATRRIGGGTGTATLEEMDNGTVVVFQDWGRVQDWMLIPYVHHIPNIGALGLGEAIRRVLSLPNGDRITPQALGAALRTATGRRQLQACYDRIGRKIGVGRPSNAVSMSLYSGPSSTAAIRKWQWRGDYESAFFFEFYARQTRQYDFPDSNGRLGWIGTGDAELQDPSVRNAWMQFFRGVAKHIGVLVLPHHGSSRSFDREILDLGCPTIIVSSSNPDHGRWGHPNESVKDSVWQARRLLVQVSYKYLSRFEETIFLE